MVREILTRIARAKPISTITGDLNARDVPSPTEKQWQRQSVRRVALNPTYIGQRLYGASRTRARAGPGGRGPVVRR